MPITDAEFLALKPKDTRYKVSIGKGAYLLVMPNGHKYWRLKFYLNGKENAYALGVFPDIPIKAALAARDSAKALIKEGINPAMARREAKHHAAFREPLFLLALSKNGTLTIENDTNVLALTVQQTQALAAFLSVRVQLEKDSSQ